MSQENVEIADRLVEEVGRGDFKAAMELVEPDFEWQTSPNLPDAGVFSGSREALKIVGLPESGS